jgi:hypothetical protein
LSTDAVVTDSGLPDPAAPGAGQIAVEKLPEEALVFLLDVAASRQNHPERTSDVGGQLRTTFYRK